MENKNINDSSSLVNNDSSKPINTNDSNTSKDNQTNILKDNQASAINDNQSTTINDNQSTTSVTKMPNIVSNTSTSSSSYDKDISYMKDITGVRDITGVKDISGLKENPNSKVFNRSKDMISGFKEHITSTFSNKQTLDMKENVSQDTTPNTEDALSDTRGAVSNVKDTSSCTSNNNETRIVKAIVHTNEPKQFNSMIKNVNEQNVSQQNEQAKCNNRYCSTNNNNNNTSNCALSIDNRQHTNADNAHYIDVKSNTPELISQPPILTAAEYIREKKYNIKIDEWFNDIWCCLIEDTDIIITKPILNFIFKNRTDISTSTYDIFKSYREQYKNYLTQCKIPFEILKYCTNIVEKYPVLKGDLYVSNNPTKKSWIKLSFKHFKESILLLSSVDSKETRKMLILLEQIFYDYNRYAISYHTRQIAIDYKNKLMLKEKENKELKNKICIINDIVIQKGKLYRDKIFYIATSRLYGMQNIFKIGGLDNRNLIKTMFNTNDTENDSLFYVAIYECHDYHLVSHFLSSFLGNFKIPNKEELYKINFDNLNAVVRMIIGQYDEYISYFNKMQPRFIDDLVFIRNLQENTEIQNKGRIIPTENKLKSHSS